MVVVEAMEEEVEAGGEDMEEGVSTEEVEGVAGRAGGTHCGDDTLLTIYFLRGGGYDGGRGGGGYGGGRGDDRRGGGGGGGGGGHQGAPEDWSKPTAR